MLCEQTVLIIFVPNAYNILTIIHIPKSKKPRELSEFRPDTLMSLPMTFFEKVIKDMVVSSIDTILNSLQYE